MRASLLLLSCLLLTDTTVGHASPMSLTTYDDGRSCPANCDAHVVFHRSHNGTANAFLPGDGRDPLGNRAHAGDHPCVAGKPCVVCFDDDVASCLVAVYRGNGPPPGRVDATPAFMRETCGKPSPPAAVATECTRLTRAAADLERRINCIANPAHPECHSRMAAAEAARAADEPELARCRRSGVEAYNAAQPDPTLHRSPHAGCEYYLNRRKTNSHGTTWMMLSPAACRSGTFVGPNGTDCCSGDVLQAAVDVAECRWFYPKGS